MQQQKSKKAVNFTFLILYYLDCEFSKAIRELHHSIKETVTELMNKVTKKS